MSVYAFKGERIITPEGKYLGIVSRDVVRGDRWSFSLVDDCQIDISKASERLPVTSWLVSKARERLDG